MSIKYDFTPMLQPTNNSCTQTATAMLLSHYTPGVTVENVLAQSATTKNDDGENAGSSMQQLAVYCIEQGHKVEFYSFDSMILDLTWRDLGSEELLKKLEIVKDIRDVASLGKTFSKQYVEEYIDFISNGGSLIIQPYPTKELLSELIAQGPLCVAVNHPTLQSLGHTRSLGLRKDVQDDTENGITTHAILVYGQDDDGDFLIADPWGDPESYTASSDQLIASIMAAQWLCDNIFFRIVS